MNINLTARTAFKLCYLGVLIWLLVFLVIRLMIMNETIDIMIGMNKSFV